MLFLVETNNPYMKIESFLWKDLLQSKTCPYDFRECTIDELASVIQQNSKREMVPLGSIRFTNQFFQMAHNIPQINPIEIPPILRTPYFLGRKYEILPFESLPQTGAYFIKDASQLKVNSYCGDMKCFPSNEYNHKHVYVVSEIVDIISEYRVYILQGDIYAVEYYNGDPLTFPDAKTIHTANQLYSTQRDYPKSYTMDVMVTPHGTFITEIHPVLFACGLYTTVLNTQFLSGYIDGLHYILKYNTPVTTT